MWVVRWGANGKRERDGINRITMSFLFTENSGSLCLVEMWLKWIQCWWNKAQLTQVELFSYQQSTVWIPRQVSQRNCLWLTSAYIGHCCVQRTAHQSYLWDPRLSPCLRLTGPELAAGRPQRLNSRKCSPTRLACSLHLQASVQPWPRITCCLLTVESSALHVLLNGPARHWGCKP